MQRSTHNHAHSRRRPRKRRLLLEALDQRSLMAADLAIVDDGMAQNFVEEVQAELNSRVLRHNLPFVGDALQHELTDSAGQSSQFLGKVADNLGDLSLSGNANVTDVTSALQNVLGASLTSIDVRYPTGDNSDVQFHLSLRETQQFENATQLNLPGADPQLELLLQLGNNAVDLDLHWRYDLIFGVREDSVGDSRLYFETSATDELQLDYVATVDAGALNAKGKIGVLVGTFTQPDKSLRYEGNFTLNVGQSASRSPTLSGLLSGSGTAEFQAIAELFPDSGSTNNEALFNLMVTTDAIVGYQTELRLDEQGHLDASQTNEITIAFHDVSLDVGRLQRELIDPFVFQLKDKLQPIKPVIDFLTDRMPVVSDLSEAAGQGPVSIVDVASVSDPLANVLKAADAILDYDGLTNIYRKEEELFSYRLALSGWDPQDGDRPVGEPEITESKSPYQDPDPDQQKAKTSALLGADLGVAFDLPILTDGDVLKGLLYGEPTSDLVTLGVDFSGELGFERRYPIPHLANLVGVDMSFTFQIEVDLDGGYDALGIQRLTDSADFTSESALENSLRNNRALLTHGFYLDDHNDAAGQLGAAENTDDDAPEVVFRAVSALGVWAGVDTDFVRLLAGVNGNIGGSLEFDLNDLPDPDVALELWQDPGVPEWSNTTDPSQWIYDGRIRGPEIAAIKSSDPMATANVDGSLEAGLSVTLEAGLFGFDFVDKEWELASATIVDGNIFRANDSEIISSYEAPRLGSVTNNQLTLYIGEMATHRQKVDPVGRRIEHESLTVQSLGRSENGETILVVMEGAQGQKFGRVFYDVQSIRGDAGSGNDRIYIMQGVEADLEIMVAMETT